MNSRTPAAETVMHPVYAALTAPGAPPQSLQVALVRLAVFFGPTTALFLAARAIAHLL
jgi:hypothetical protein